MCATSLSGSRTVERAGINDHFAGGHGSHVSLAATPSLGLAGHNASVEITFWTLLCPGHIELHGLICFGNSRLEKATGGDSSAMLTPHNPANSPCACEQLTL
jgi:hypothetical protein